MSVYVRDLHVCICECLPEVNLSMCGGMCVNRKLLR